MKKTNSGFKPWIRGTALLVAVVFLSSQPLYAKSYKGNQADLSELFQKPKTSDLTLSLGISLAACFMPSFSSLAKGSGFALQSSSKGLANFGFAMFSGEVSKAAMNFGVTSLKMKPGTAQIFGYGVNGVMAGVQNFYERPADFKWYSGKGDGFLKLGTFVNNHPLLTSGMVGALQGVTIGGTQLALANQSKSGIYRALTPFVSLGVGTLSSAALTGLVGINTHTDGQSSNSSADRFAGVKLVLASPTFQSTMIAQGVGGLIEGALEKKFKYARIIGTGVGSYAAARMVDNVTPWNALKEGVLSGVTSVALEKLSNKFKDSSLLERSMIEFAGTTLVRAIFERSFRGAINNAADRQLTIAQARPDTFSTALKIQQLANMNGISDYKANADWLVKATGKPWKQLVKEGQTEKLLPGFGYTIVNYTANQLHYSAVDNLTSVVRPLVDKGINYFRAKEQPKPEAVLQHGPIATEGSQEYAQEEIAKNQAAAPVKKEVPKQATLPKPPVPAPEQAEEDAILAAESAKDKTASGNSSPFDPLQDSLSDPHWKATDKPIASTPPGTFDVATGYYDPRDGYIHDYDGTVLMKPDEGEVEFITGKQPTGEQKVVAPSIKEYQAGLRDPKFIQSLSHEAAQEDAKARQRLAEMIDKGQNKPDVAAAEKPASETKQAEKIPVPELTLDLQNTPQMPTYSPTQDLKIEQQKPGTQAPIVQAPVAEQYPLELKTDAFTDPLKLQIRENLKDVQIKLEKPATIEEIINALKEVEKRDSNNNEDYLDGKITDRQRAISLYENTLLYTSLYEKGILMSPISDSEKSEKMKGCAALIRHIEDRVRNDAPGYLLKKELPNGLRLQMRENLQDIQIEPTTPTAPQQKPAIVTPQAPAAIITPVPEKTLPEYNLGAKANPLQYRTENKPTPVITPPPAAPSPAPVSPTPAVAWKDRPLDSQDKMVVDGWYAHVGDWLKGHPYPQTKGQVDEMREFLTKKQMEQFGK